MKLTSRLRDMIINKNPKKEINSLNRDFLFIEN